MNKVLPPFPGKYTGKVKWYSEEKGFGFILPDTDASLAERDIFVHATDVHASNLRCLTKDTFVEFHVVDNGGGRPKAVNIRTLYK